MSMPMPMPESDFREMFREHFDDLWRFARRRCDSGADADDIVAQTFAVAWRRRDELPAEAARLWLFGTARNVLANQARSGRRRERVRLRLVGERGPATEADVVEVVERALDGLPEDDLDLVRLRYWERLPVQDIATLHGITPNAVSIRLHRIRTALREQLAMKETRHVG